MSCDCEPASAYQEVKRIARKPHICDECKIEIIKGEAYTSAKYLVDGDWGAYKICQDCDAIAKKFSSITEECYVFSQLIDELIDCGFIRKIDGVWASEEDWIEIKSQDPLRVKKVVV